MSGSDLTFEEARRRLLAQAVRIGAERVALDAADGRVLAENVLVERDAPEADTSAMDGYAVRAADVHEPSVALEIRGEARPGGECPAFIAPGTACRIFTGAILPAGADAVVIQEDVDVAEGRVTFARARTPVPIGHNVRRRGEDLAAGAIALASGRRLSPSKLGLLASLDRPWVTVTRRPRVVILGTGDELRLPGQMPPHVRGSVAESGTLVVRGMAQRAGGDAVVVPMVRDDRGELTRALEDALRGSDLVVTVGGMSEGDYDLVRPVMAEIGVVLDFWKVAIKPGKPLAVGKRRDAHVLGLPGNPAAAVITFGLFGVPLLRALQGDVALLPEVRRARLATRVVHKPGRLSFLRATLSVASDDGAMVATPLAHQSSGSIATLAQAHALLLVPSETPSLEAGAIVELITLAELGA